MVQQPKKDRLGKDYNKFKDMYHIQRMYNRNQINPKVSKTLKNKTVFNFEKTEDIE